MPNIDFSKLPGTFGRDVDAEWFPWPFPGPGADAIRFKVRRSDHEAFLKWARSIDKDGVMARAGAKASKLMTLAEVRTGFRKDKKGAKKDPAAEKERAEALLADAYEKALEEQPDEAFVALGDPHLPAIGTALYRVEEIEGIEGGDRPGVRLAFFGFSGVLTPDGEAITETDLANRGDAFRAKAAGDPNFETIVPGWRFEDGSPMVVTQGKYIGKPVPVALREYVGECAEQVKEHRDALFAEVDSDSSGSDACSGEPSAA